MAVLAPGLGDRLELHVRRLALEGREMFLDRLHLMDVQEKLPLLAERQERAR